MTTFDTLIPLKQENNGDVSRVIRSIFKDNECCDIKNKLVSEESDELKAIREQEDFIRKERALNLTNTDPNFRPKKFEGKWDWLIKLKDLMPSELRETTMHMDLWTDLSADAKRNDLGSSGQTVKEEQEECKE